jgi:precorrin isomerase
MMIIIIKKQKKLTKKKKNTKKIKKKKKKKKKKKVWVLGVAGSPPTANMEVSEPLPRPLGVVLATTKWFWGVARPPPYLP